jgi:prepilin-type N-terminal cleavage/methylation domain-containing protein
MEINMHSRGFTLIELLIVVALFGILAVAGTGMFLSLVGNNRKTEAVLDLGRKGSSIIELVQRQWAFGKDIVSDLNLCSAQTRRVTILTVDDRYFDFRCKSVEPSFIITREADSLSELTGAAENIMIDSETDYRVSNCSMVCTDTGGRHAINLTFTLTNKFSGEEEIFNIYSSLRNSHP